MKEDTPFVHGELIDFFDEEQLIAVSDALVTQEFFHKESDLFSLYQTADLSSVNDIVLAEFRDFLYTDFKAFIEEMTSFSLSDKVDLHGSLYEDTQYLLCHDDQLDSRKIAFLIYLTNFEDGDGGELALYDSVDKKPRQIVKKIIPRFNKVAFFEVSDISYHSVEEVLCDKQRLAIGGWFHVK